MYKPVVLAWMDKLDGLLKKYNYPPQLIFNMDETMLDSSGHKVKVISQASAPRPFTENEIKMEHITLGLCISASGGYLKPLAILPLKTLPYLDPSILNFYYLTGQENRFINNEIWHQWALTVLIPYVVKMRQQLGLSPNFPALFIVDSHSTRKYEPTILLFQQYNIHVLILPAHSSATLQPLDLSCNGELKRLLKHHFKPVSDEDRPTKRNRLLYTTVECLQQALGGILIKKGFSKAGIYPFSREAPLNSTLVKDAIDGIDFRPPAVKSKAIRFAGKLLTGTPDAMYRVLPSSLPSSSLSAPIQPILAPTDSEHQITPTFHYSKSLTYFINL